MRQRTRGLPQSGQSCWYGAKTEDLALLQLADLALPLLAYEDDCHGV